MPIVIKKAKKGGLTIKRTGTSAPAAVVERPAHRLVVHCDPVCQGAIDTAPNSIVAWILMAGYAYHIHDVELISDGLFDYLCRRLALNWEEATHMHKHMLNLDLLEAGSLYQIAAKDYPITTRGAAAHLLRQHGHPRINIDH